MTNVSMEFLNLYSNRASSNRLKVDDLRRDEELDGQSELGVCHGRVRNDAWGSLIKIFFFLFVWKKGRCFLQCRDINHRLTIGLRQRSGNSLNRSIMAFDWRWRWDGLHCRDRSLGSNIPLACQDYYINQLLREGTHIPSTRLPLIHKRL